MARAIDQDEVLYQLERLRLDAQLKDECEEEAIKRCISAVKLVPTLTPPNEWVSVEDTVPDPGERVLATDGIFVGEAYRSSANSWFRHARFPWRDGVTGRTVRFWMPLPAPPDKGNNVPIKAPNDPLTQADLDSMDYDKVWIDYEDDCGEWALVCNGYIYSIDTLEGAGLDFGDYMRGERLEPHGYKVYRRPPEGEEDA